MTLETARTVLVVIRTHTTLAWLLEILPDVLGDTRIQLVYTITGDRSAYSSGLEDALRDLELTVIPWAQAVVSDFDLAIAASHSGGLTQLRAPLLILPHGPGYTRKTSVPNPYLGTAEQHLHGAHPFTVTYALANTETQPTLPVGSHTAVTGDPAFDSLTESLRDRAWYREALGVSETQTLIVMSSTWGKDSLFGSDPEVFEKVLAELPSDQFVVAAILHPNIWVGHGRWQVQLWLRRAREAGLRVIPFEQGWRAALVAADTLIGDHGSVTFYAAALGRPVWVASYGDDEMLPETPLTDFGSLAPRLGDPNAIRQTISSINSLVDSGKYEVLRDAAFAHQGHALENLRDVIYKLLELDPLRRALPRRVTPPARVLRADPTAHLVVTSVDVGPTRTADALSVSVERFPAWAANHRDLSTAHLVVDVRDPDVGLRQSASVLVDVQAGHSAVQETEQLLLRYLNEYPGAFLVAAALGAGQTIILTKDARMIVVDSVAQKPLPVLLAASVVREWALIRSTSRTLQVRVGSKIWEASLTVLN